MQAREKELTRKTCKQLRVVAGELGVRGLKSMRHAELVQAILAAEEEQELEPFEPLTEEESEEEQEDQEPRPEHRDLANELSLDHYQRIRNAETSGLKVVLEDSNLERPLREAVERELDRRQRVEAERKRRSELQSPLAQYRVTKGGQYIRDGHITMLAEGSLVGPLTHDLQDVEAQGIEFTPVKHGILLGEDQLGNQTSQVV